MARGTQHRKRRTPAHARVAAPSPAQAKRVTHQRWEDQLFFSRLRVHAKWMFVFLALVFGVGFVIFGVGSGSTGISDVLQNFFTGSSSSGPSLSSLEQKAQQSPKQAQAWRSLATKLESDGKVDGAVTALERYTALKPDDQDALEELASLYLRRASDEQQTYLSAETEAQVLAPTPPAQPSPSSKLGQALASLQSPVSTAVSSTIGAQGSAAYGKLVQDETAAVSTYEKLAKLSPKDATTQLRLAQVAQGAGDVPTAVSAYKRFLKLAPDDPSAAAAKQALRQLQPTATAGGKHK